MVAKEWFWAVYLLPCAISVGEDEFCQRSAQADVLANITADYDPTKRPHWRREPEDVDIQFYLTSLTEIDQKGQELGVAGYFRVSWSDPRLAFTSTSEGGCFDSLLLSEADFGKIWKPDIYFDNSLQEIRGASMYQVNASGSVWKSERINHLFECKMDFRRLPYDSQTCSITIASYSEDATEVRVHARGGVGVVLPEKRPATTTWDIKEVRSLSELRQLAHNPWSYLHLEVVIKRRPDYYLRGIALKAVLFVVISWCGFFVNRNVAPARVAIGTIPVLIMINLMNAVDAFLPPISYSTLLTDFLMVCLVFTSLVVFEYGFVAYLLQIEARTEEKHHILMNLGTSYLKKQEPQRTDSAMSNGEEQAPAPAPQKGGSGSTSVEEKTQEPAEKTPTPAENTQEPSATRTRTTSGRFTISVRSGNSAKYVPTNIFDEHPVITEVFKEFDRKRNGRYSVDEFRTALRGFGQYRSKREVHEMFDKLGVASGKDLTLDQFEVFLSNPSAYLPVATTRRSFWDMPPSLQVDIFMRFAFPSAFGLVTLILYVTAVA